MPEIETIARRLRKTVVGKNIESVHLSGLPLRRPIDPVFSRRLASRTIRRIHRRGKYLIAELRPRAYWLVHLGMSGRLHFAGRDDEVEKHTQAIVRFTDSTELRYEDHRRFGLMAAYETRSLDQIPEVRSLGRDPLDTRFDHDWLHPQLLKSRQEIKSFLLDQRKIAGLGNIYVCEALFLSRIHPARRCFTFSVSETRRLIESIRAVLRAAIRHRGTSFSDYIDTNGRPGRHQRFLRVFQREGEDCPVCRSGIRRLRQGNRSSYYCPACQKERPARRADKEVDLP